MLNNVLSSQELRGLAIRRARDHDLKTVRNQLLEEELAQGWEVAKKNRASTRLRRPKARDRLLEDRVWMLLYRMGFLYLSGNGGAFQLLKPGDPEGPENQIDIVAIDSEVAFAIECKSKSRPGRFDDFSRDLAKHVALRDGFIRAVRTQFPVPTKRVPMFCIWTSGLVLNDNDRARATAAKVSLLDERDLAYYEDLVTQIGAAARFQFLGAVLGGRPIPGLEVKVPAIRSKMGGSTAYTFSIPPEYLLKIAFVSHRARGKASDIDAYQRMLRKSRLRSIRQYISDGGIFPTNIVVNIADARRVEFDRGRQESQGKGSVFGWLTLRPAYKVAWVIDGQHRLFAYAGHPDSESALVSTMAFVGLPPSKQAQLFVDINAEQRKVKQSLLQELYAELHWDSEDPQVRVQAVLSKAIQALDSQPTSPFYARILKADDKRTDRRCVSLTSVFHALEKTEFFVARVRHGVVDFGPLWAGDGQRTLRRTLRVLTGYFDAIRGEAPTLWDLGSTPGGGLAMNDGVTVAINVLRSVVHHVTSVKRIPLDTLDDDEVVRVLGPYGRRVGTYFAGLGADQMRDFRALRGVQGQTTGTRRVEQALRTADPSFNPPGLTEYLERERAQTTTRAFEVITRIEKVLQQTVVGELKQEFGSDEQSWFYSGVPKEVRKAVLERINEEAGKKGGPEENFDLISYRSIATANWQIFEGLLGFGKGSKDARTKWIVEVNDLRKQVMHASKGQHLPITEEQLARLQQIEGLLTEQIEGGEKPHDMVE